MNENIWILTSANAVTIATTLILAALGALFTERSGVLNLGVEESFSRRQSLPSWQQIPPAAFGSVLQSEQ
jgi:hypothetical protein